MLLILSITKTGLTVLKYCQAKFSSILEQITTIIYLKMKNNRFFDQLRQILLDRHPSAFLLAAQFVLLILYAAVDGREGHRLVISVFGLVVLLMVLWVVTSSARVQWMAWIIAAPDRKSVV